MEMATLGSTPIASSYYQVKVGGDAAALKGIMKALLALDAETGRALDHAFIAEHTLGFEALAADLAAAGWEEIERESGLSRSDLERVAAAYAASSAAMVTYGMGVTQHIRGTRTVQQIANLLLLRGNFGKPGAGICPLRGHSNVQGDRTVGITEKPSPALLDGIEDVFGFRPPAAHGHDAVACMQAMVEGRAKVLFCLGGNLAVALPDPVACAKGMRNLDLCVHLSTKLNRSHLLIGKESIILPVLGRTELDLQAAGAQAVTVEDSMSMVHASRGRLAPASEHLRSEPAIVAGMAAATLPQSRIDWMGLAGDYDRIRDKIEAVFPDFHDYNARIRKPGGFRLPIPPAERVWQTPSGKAAFLVLDGVDVDPATDGADVLKLTTIRSHDQYNTTIYGFDDRYRGVFGRRDVIFMNARDLAERGLQHGDELWVEPTAADGAARRLKLTAVRHDIAYGSAAAYYPEANGLVPLAQHDPESGTPGYKSAPVRVSKAPV
jgi:molybdopterin-dependent oxidoreductase alpha subunit